MARHNQKVGMKRVDLELTRLSLGTAPLAGLFKSVDISESDQLIHTALDNGMNYFDTAPLYGHGLAEERLGRILGKVSQSFVLQTKVGRVLNWVEKADPVPWFPDADPHIQPVFDYSADGIKRSLDDSLKRLGVDHIDIALMHDAENHIPQAINIAYPVLADLKRQGIIKAIGIGINFCDVAIEIMKNVDLESPYNVKNNPLPWTQKWISGAEVQVAPQETEITSYVSGGTKQDVSEDSFKGFSL